MAEVFGFLANFTVPDWVLYGGGVLLLGLIGVLLFLRNKRPSDD